MNELALFAGAGGGILGGKLLGWRTVCAVEWESYPASVLCARQNDGILPPFPIWDDVQTFDGKPWRGIVDVVSGGFPCQDISAAGRGAGIEGSRSGMWKHMARIIGEVRPRFAFVENSPMLVGRGAAMVIGDLAEMGYDCEWCIVSASDCGAPHRRDRFWLVAWDTDSENVGTERGIRRGEIARTSGVCAVANAVRKRSPSQRNEAGEQSGLGECGEMADTSQLQRNGINNHAGISMESGQVSEFGNGSWTQVMANPDSAQRKGNKRAERIAAQRADIGEPRWWAFESRLGGAFDGLAERLVKPATN